MYLEIILICGLIFSLQQIRIIDLQEDLNQWKNTSLLNQREKYKNEQNKRISSKTRGRRD